MSQRNVEWMIGRLVTDEAFRRRFTEDPAAAIREVTVCGVELSDLERRVLAALNPRLIARFAQAIDPRIQKVCAREGRP